MECISQGKEVIVVKCNGKLPACLQSDRRSILRCMECQSRTEAGLKLLPKGAFTVVELPFCKKPVSSITASMASVDDILKIKWDTADLGRAAMSSLSMRHNYEHRFDDLPRHIPQIKRDIFAGYYVYEGMKKIFDKYSIDKAYLFNGRFASLRALMRLCQSRGIDFATHERGGLVEKYWVIESSIPHDTDYTSREAERLWKTHDEKDYKEAEEWYLKRRSGKSISWYSFVENQDKARLPEGFEEYKHKVKVAIYNSTIGEYWCVDGWDGLIYDDPGEGIDRIVSELKDDSRFIFFLRVHPNLANNPDNAQMRDIEKLKRKHRNLVVIPPESTISSYALLDNADLVLTFGSTMGAEACFWAKTSILAGKAAFDGLDCCYVARKHEEVIGYLNKIPPPKPKERALVYSSWEMRRGKYFKHFIPKGFDDGKFKGVRIQTAWYLRKIAALHWSIKKTLIRIRGNVSE